MDLESSIPTNNLPESSNSKVAPSSEAVPQSEIKNVNPEGLSKNQQKRLRKLQYKLEKRKEKRVIEKARKKEKRQRMRDEGRGDELKKKQRRKMEESECKMNIVVDLGYENLMHENNLRNTITQLSYCYNANRTMSNPAQYHITGMSNKTKELFNQLTGTKSWDVIVHEQQLQDLTIFDPSKIVYLTADSDNTINELDDEDVYVIGGLLDHNRHPGVSLQRAKDNNWRHGRLPIGDFVKMNSRKVLTINHVFEILLQYWENRNWEEAFFKVIPKRKGAQKLEETSEEQHEDKDTSRSEEVKQENEVISADIKPEEPSQHE